MSEKISIACPSCQKRYSTPADLGHRKLKCKACGTDFRLTNLLLQQATPTPAQREPTFDASLGNAGKSNLSQPDGDFNFGARFGAHFAFENQAK